MCYNGFVQNSIIWLSAPSRKIGSLSMIKNNTGTIRNQELIHGKLTNRKTLTMRLYDRVLSFGDFKHAVRYYNCGTQIEMQNGSIKTANFCRDRFCPMCEWRRTKKLTSQNMMVYDAIKNETAEEKDIHKKNRMIFLTLTVPNVPLSDLGSTLRNMSAGWNRFRNHRAVKKQPIIGFARKLEITYNEKTNTYHPHYHVLMTVRGWSADQKSWAHWWTVSMQSEIGLIVDIRAAYDDDTVVVDTQAGKISSSVRELSKYMAKASDVLEAVQTADDWETLRAAVGGVREVSYGGIWRDYRKKFGFVDIEKDDLTDNEVVTHSEEPIEQYEWHFWRYELVGVRYEWCAGDDILRYLHALKKPLCS